MQDSTSKEPERRTTGCIGLNPLQLLPEGLKAPVAPEANAQRQPQAEGRAAFVNDGTAWAGTDNTSPFPAAPILID
jgi:hypothetical protein